MNTREFWLRAWAWNPWAVLAALLALGVYGWLCQFRFRPRAAFIVAAASLFVLTLVSPLETLGRSYLFSAHMAQHLLLLLIIPGLALLSWPKATHDRTETNCDPGLRPESDLGPKIPKSTASRITMLISNPLSGWLAGVGAMWLWHAPVLCDAAVTKASVRGLQVVSLVLMGGLFWWPVLRPDSPRRLPALAGVIYLFTACLGCTLLGILITFAPVSVCSVFMHPTDRLGVLPLIRNQWGLTRTVDQQIGGLMMWVPACSIYLVGIVGLLLRWFAETNPESGTFEPLNPQPAPLKP